MNKFIFSPSNTPQAMPVEFETAYMITVTSVVPENLRANMDVEVPLSVVSEFAKIGYVNQENFMLQRRKLMVSPGRVRNLIEVNGFTIKFYHVFDTLENANNFLNGVYKEVYDENTILRGFELPSESIDVREITASEWIIISDGRLILNDPISINNE